MSSEISTTEQPRSELVEKVIIQGDLSSLSSEERVRYYAAVCNSMGLNPLTRPFDYLKLNGKLVLYAKRDCTDQLRRIQHVSIVITTRELIEDVYVVTARASLPDGRSDESTGAVSIAGLRGEALANAYMKAESKAKRRATLSLCGLGLLDETEAEPLEDRAESKPRPAKATATQPRETDVSGDWETALRSAATSQAVEAIWREMHASGDQTKTTKALMLECWGRCLLREEAEHQRVFLALLVDEMRKRGIDAYSKLNRKIVREIGEAVVAAAKERGETPSLFGDDTDDAEYQALINVDLETGEVTDAS